MCHPFLLSALACGAEGRAVRGRCRRSEIATEPVRGLDVDDSEVIVATPIG